MGRKEWRAMAVVGGATAALFCLIVYLCIPKCGKIQGNPGVGRRVPAPILFLHGFGSGAETWKDARLTDFLQSKGLRFGGTVRIDGKGEARIEGSSAGADFFLLAVSSSFQGLDGWTRDIAKLVAKVREATQAPRVVLVGHSAGGLAGRRYLVEHFSDHHLAKLVTVASPHRGSELGWLWLLKKKLQSTPIDAWLAGVERGVGTPLDSPLLHDLLPERQNPALARLNKTAHPTDVEYSCLRAAGSPDADNWAALGKLFDSMDLENSPFLQDAITKLMMLNAFREGVHSSRGDGAILEASQDLREIEFFKNTRSLIQDCPSVDVGHHAILEQHRAILAGITSPVHFRAARRVSDPGADCTQIVVDFDDAFAGLTEVVVRSSPTHELLPVSRPVIMEKDGASFGQVQIGPFDSSRSPMIEIVVRSLDRGRRYGKQILLRNIDRAALPKHEKPKPIMLTLLGLEGIPRTGILLSRPDIRIVLSVDQHEVFSKVIEDVDRVVALREAIELADDPRESEITLEVRIAGQTGDPIGRFLWPPGEFPRSTALVRSKEGLAVRLKVSGADEERAIWEGEAFSLAPMPASGGRSRASL
ncbi:MAG TPA: alpha/beta fold hydrolase [Thermoanaerobaculia bacterium]|jgi:pimeloyl-ACP methyl ester carboxylesterase|nr:alpha/beta fold hydrolase [Thermoanaerobaculia bacterium]